MLTSILIWWLVVQALGLAGMPLARFLFRALPDRGYAFGKTLGLLLTGYLAWLLAMLGLAPFGRGLLVACALAVAGAGLLVQRRLPTMPGAASVGITAAPVRPALPLPEARAALAGWLREHWRMIVAYEALFALALVFLALLRSYDSGFTGPNPWGTERPMDYAFFNAIRRSVSFPPHDPWLSGYSINYYYFGYLLMAVVALFSGLDPAVAYNLSLALVFALTALGAAGIVVNLVGLANGREQRTKNKEQRTEDRGPRTGDRREITEEQEPATGSPREDGGWRIEDDTPAAKRSSSILQPPSPIPGGRWVAALLAAVLVLFAGNQAGALQVIVGDERVVAMDGRQLASAVGQALAGQQQIVLPQPVRTSDGDFGTFYTFEHRDRVADFNWWWPSRAVWDDYTRRGDPNLHYTITEFPFFSFWLGDMHPHVMALPFGLLALALALQTLARPAAPPFAMGRRGWVELALTGIVLGSLYAINSWDLPTYVLLFLGALLLLYIRLGRLEIGDSPSESPTSNLQSPISRVWWRQYAAQAAMVLLAAAVLFGPFHLTFRSLVGGAAPLVDLPILATLTRTIGFVAWSRTPLHSFLIIFGLFLLPLVVYVFAQRGRGGEGERVGWLEAWVDGLPWAVLGALIAGPLVGFALLALLPLALYAALLAAERAEQPATAFVLWAFALVCLICFGTEVVYIRDVFESRMNTIFKFYYQAWLIWGTLAGYAVYWLATRLRTKNKEPRTKQRRAVFGSRILVLGSLVVFVALLTGALVFPWLTAGKAFREARQVGLAGVTPRQNTPAGAAAIEWLRGNAPADTVIVEAVNGSYDTGSLGFGGVSASTGLPAVLGWPGHEQQWRGGDPATLAQVGIREEDVRTLFSTTSIETARGLLHKYKVGFVYVGQAERETYPAEGLTKFDQLGTPVFQQDEVTIYEVPEG